MLEMEDYIALEDRCHGQWLKVTVYPHSHMSREAHLSGGNKDLKQII